MSNFKVVVGCKFVMFHKPYVHHSGLGKRLFLSKQARISVSLTKFPSSGAYFPYVFFFSPVKISKFPSLELRNLPIFSRPMYILFEAVDLGYFILTSCLPKNETVQSKNNVVVKTNKVLPL